MSTNPTHTNDHVYAMWYAGVIAEQGLIACELMRSTDGRLYYDSEGVPYKSRLQHGIKHKVGLLDAACKLMHKEVQGLVTKNDPIDGEDTYANTSGEFGNLIDKFIKAPQAIRHELTEMVTSLADNTTAEQFAECVKRFNGIVKKIKK
jgi:hypothetical protein